MIPCTPAPAARNSDFTPRRCYSPRRQARSPPPPLQLCAQAGEQPHRAAVDALHLGHLEVERLAARCSGLEPAQLGPERSRLRESEDSAEADLAPIGSRLHVLDCKCRQHVEDLSGWITAPVG